MGLEDKISELIGYAEEQEWFGFKENWFQPDELGEYVSAISNSAAFHDQEMGYFLWGVKDEPMKLSALRSIPIWSITKNHIRIIWRGIFRQA